MEDRGEFIEPAEFEYEEVVTKIKQEELKPNKKLELMVKHLDLN